MRILKTVLLLVVVACAVPVRAQNAPPVPGPNVAKVHGLLPKEAVACLSVRIQQIKTDQALRLVPWEIMSAASLEGVGIDLSEIDRFDFIIGPIGQTPAIAGVITGKSKLDLTKLNSETFQLMADGKTYRIAGGREFRNMILTPLNDGQVAIGDSHLMPEFLDAERGAGELHKQMQRLGENSHITFVFVPGPVRTLLLQGLSQMPPELAGDAKILAEKLQLIAAKAQVDTNPTINILMEAANEQDAEAVEGAWNRLANFATTQLIHEMTGQAFNSTLLESLSAYGSRARKEMITLLTPTRKGSRLLLSIDQRAINFARGLTVLGNLGLNQRGGGPSFVRPMGNNDVQKLKELALAAHNFHDTFRYLPTNLDPRTKKPNLSWRVRVLPFVEQVELYNQFKMDEPWDSESNIKLLDKMPPIFKFSKAKAAAGHTVIQMPLGPGLASEIGKNLSFRDFTDGTSNTVMFALSTDAAAVPWTKPDDFNPLDNPGLIRRDNGKVIIALADGSVTELSEPQAKELERLLTRGAGD